MPANLRLTFATDPSAVVRVLETLGEGMADWRPAWERLLPALPAGAAEAVRSAGASLGVPMAELSPDYARRKARRYAGRGTLVRTGRLLGELSTGGGRSRMTPFRVGWGPSLRYAYALHFGVPVAVTTRHRRRKSQGAAGKLPPRPFLTWSPEMEEQAIRIVNQRAEEILAAATSGAK